MKIRSNIQAGGLSMNHNQAVACGTKVKTNVRAGGSLNHTQTLVREAKKNLRVKTKIKAGVFKTVKLTD